MNAVRNPNVARFLGALLLGSVALMLPSCEQGGHFTVLGYTTRPNYNPNIHTVRVNIFKNYTMYQGLEFELAEALTRDIEAITPYKVVGVGCNADTELTGTILSYGKNVINRTQLNEIREAETVLVAAVVWRDLRSGEILSRPIPGAAPPMPLVGPELGAPLPPGMMSPGLETPGPGTPGFIPPGLETPGLGTPGLGTPGLGMPGLGMPAQPTEPGVLPPTGPVPLVTGLPGTPPPLPIPTLIQSTATFRPELGESITTARQKNVLNLSVQIRSMMESPW